MEELKKLLVKPTVKVALQGVFTIANAVLCNFTVGSGKLWRWVVFLLVIGLNIFTLIKYAQVDLY